MNRREFLKACAAGAGALGLASPLARSASMGAGGERPNILWLIAEDFCPDLGCYGLETVRTPNLDRLAGRGARYTNAFTTSPVCSPSRSAFMTGMYQTTIGAHQHRTLDRKPLEEPVKLITEYFRHAGYFTSSCRHNAWGRPGKTDFNFKVDGAFDGTDWRQRKEGQPFFSLVQFSETHRNFERDPDHPVDPGKVELPPYYPDHPIARRDWADYLECAQVLDRKVGEVCRRLEEDGLAENTAVFFFGDNGRPHVRGKQWLYEGGIHVPLIIRWPGRIEGGSVKDDLVSAVDLGPTSLALAGIAPAAHLQGRDFLNPDTPKREFIAAARDRCDETFDRIRCIRTTRYKYIRNFFPHLPYAQQNLYKLRQYPVATLLEVLHAEGKLTPGQSRFMAPFRPAEELYDLASDPHELSNLAEDGRHAPVLQAMRGRMEAWIEETGDQGEVTEDPKVAAECALKRHIPAHLQAMKNRGLPPDIAPGEYLKYWEKVLFDRRD